MSEKVGERENQGKREKGAGEGKRAAGAGRNLPPVQPLQYVLVAIF